MSEGVQELKLISYVQATETQSHKWYLYLRGLNNEDIGHIVKKVRPRGMLTRLHA